jgi:hypothetical protein
MRITVRLYDKLVEKCSHLYFIITVCQCSLLPYVIYYFGIYYNKTALECYISSIRVWFIAGCKSTHYLEIIKPKV